MGLEGLCHLRYRGRTVEGKAHLASEALEFLGETRLVIPFKEIAAVEAKAGQLRVRFGGEDAVLDLGPQSEKWALKIRYPKGRLDKLGIKPGSKVCLLGIQDEAFRAELAERTCNVFEKPREGADFILFHVDTQESLQALATLQSYIQRDGAIWVIWPKGQKQITRDHIFAASHAAGLVDIKICAFSDTLSGLKVVIPRDRR
ncbi:MAG: hypothetical protein WAM82_35315 [Thermoanaerobaculia bacterium]